MTIFRRMLETDLVYVAKIEAQAIFDSWPEKLFHDCVRVGYSCWVAEKNDKVEGFGLLSCAVGEAHILHLAIGEEWHRQGLGMQMMEHLIDVACELQAEIVYLEFRGSNLVAKELYKRYSFIEIGLRKSYYPAEGGREDAITLALILV